MTKKEEMEGKNEMRNSIVELEEKKSEIEKISLFLEKGYLGKTNSYEIAPVSQEIEEFDIGTNIRILKIDKIVYDEKENVLDKLSNVYTSLYSTNSTIFLLLDSDGKNCDFYLGVRENNKIHNIEASKKILESGLEGNFPGIEYKRDIRDKDGIKILDGVFGENRNISEITTVTGVPSYLTNDKEKFVQGIEKLINGMYGKEFSCIIIANPISYDEIQMIRKGYENIYTDLYPYTETTVNLNSQKSYAVSENISKSISEGTVENLAKTTGTSSSNSISATTGTSYGTSKFLNAGIAISGVGIGGGKGVNTSKSNSTSHTNTNSSNNSLTISEGKQSITTNQVSAGTTEGVSNGEGCQWRIVNKNYVTLVEKIEKQLERLSVAEGNGFWETGIFFLSEEPQNSLVAGSIYNGIIRGKNSGIEKNTIHTFRGSEKNEILNYLYNVAIPKIKIKFNKNEELETSISTTVTTEELVLKMNFPKETVAGVDVIKMSTFARNNNYVTEKSINIGKLYHLGKVLSQQDVELDIETLASHTFITGSTGSGKSNTVYCLVDKLLEKNIKFLIIEPAKGEYKNVFGGRSDFKVYGTNRKISDVLRVNPFSFNENIHILEHIDRLVEIFNACWPMYAAMPAILKDAIEKAYIAKGWDLRESVNLYGKKVYPSFSTLKNILETVIDSSSYSDETKGNYKGALVTRVNSLDNGLLGTLFTANELNENSLFDENVIVDISRVPSNETKSLLMGILFMKLYEYRIGESKGENENLKHITILEEAHNLLKRTSLEQSSEGSNLQGKSVEMMTNSIAEMRTYGEGFMIVDQAPELLDLSVIRNTNTKICLKLPNYSDRKLVGKAMDLNEGQIDELAKLEVGVGAVIQSGWKESSLIKFNYMSNKQSYIYKNEESSSELKKKALKYLLHSRLPQKERNEEIDKEIYDFFKKNKIPYEGISEKNIKKVIYELLKGESILKILNIEDVSREEWKNNFEKMIINSLNLTIENELLSIICKYILEYSSENDKKYIELHNEWDKIESKRGII